MKNRSRQLRQRCSGSSGEDRGLGLRQLVDTLQSLNSGGRQIHLSEPLALEEIGDSIKSGRRADEKPKPSDAESSNESFVASTHRVEGVRVLKSDFDRVRIGGKAERHAFDSSTW